MSIIKPMKWLAVGAALLVSGQIHATVNVGGVVWDPDNLDDYFATDTMYETVAGFAGTSAVGGGIYDFTGATELTGYGKITNINGTDPSVFCPGCELTYQFGGYYLNQFLDNDTNGVVSTGDDLSFTGGWVKYYVDFTPDFNNTSAASAGSEGGANALWLEMAGFEQVDINGLAGSLFSELTSGALGTGTEGGSGFGNLDVVGGMALGNFDTNSQAGGSDFRFTSSYQPRACAPGCPEGNNLFGSNDWFADSIPEPASLALIGIGLIGFGVAGRRRKSAV